MTLVPMRRVRLDDQALDAALADWTARWPELSLLALLPEAEAAALPRLQQACRQRGIGLAGGIFPQLIDGDQLVSDGAWLLAHPGPWRMALVPDLAADAERAGRQLAQAVEGLLAEDSGAERPLLHLVFDGQLPHIGSVLDELFRHLADRVRYAGTNAGSERFTPMPCLFDAEQVIGGGALALLLPATMHSTLDHGYRPPERLQSATATQGNRIVSIDWRPAFEVYAELIRQHHGIALTPQNFYQHAVHFPFGLLRANGEVLVRIPVALADDGSLTCIGEVPQQAMLVVLPAPPAADLHCAEALARSLGPAAAGQATLLYYCAGRRMHLGDAVAAELRVLRERLAAPVLAGALSLGEVGSTEAWGYPMFHNAALVCTAWTLP